MRAIIVEQFGGPEVMQCREVEAPQPGAGQIAIKLALTGVNFADIMVRRGGYGRGSLLPLTPGLDCVGTIIALGKDVTSLKLGQRVAAFPDGGSYAEIVLARPELTYVLPDAVSNEDASGLTMLVTAYNLLTSVGRMLPGETVLIHAGAGGVGSIAIQLAKLLGAGKIIATVGSPAKLAHARHYGADVVINYRDQELRASLHSATDGKGVDLILDSVIGQEFDRGMESLAPFGRYLVYGAASGEPGTVRTNQLHQTSRAVIGYSTGSYRKFKPEALRAPINAVLAHVAQGEVSVPIGARFPLDKVAEAHALIESRTSIGKVLLDI